jgi:hypothetical protein
MDHAFFSTNQEQVLFEGVKIEAHTAGKAIDCRFFFAINLILFSVLDQF